MRGRILNDTPMKARHRVDPRARGENRILLRDVAIREGWPPRMRGEYSTPARERKETRLTPAHAGRIDIDLEITKL